MSASVDQACVWSPPDELGPDIIKYIESRYIPPISSLSISSTTVAAHRHGHTDDVYSLSAAGSSASMTAPARSWSHAIVESHACCRTGATASVSHGMYRPDL